MLEFIIKGGIFIWPIVLCSVIALAVIMERVLTLQKKKITPPGFIIELEDLLKESRFSDAKTLCKKDKSLIAQILLPVLDKKGKPRDQLKTLLDEIALREVELSSRPLQILSTIASVSPLFGLLGTVTGMVHVFSVVSEGGIGNPAMLSAGISEALYTTVAGLVVAIPAFIAFKYFQSRLRTLAIIMEEESYRILDIIHGEQ